MKSAVHKGDEVPFSASLSSETVRLVFHMGMSGQFQLTKADQLHKHAHLTFFTADHPGMALSFVDVRRFGGWQVKQEGWGQDRGYDPIDEYEQFRKTIEENLEKPLFKKPICEVMMDQRYFNGIGNYLRAEILFRVNVRPFDCARSVLEDIFKKLQHDDRSRDKSTSGRKLARQTRNRRQAKQLLDSDLLQLCRDVPLEVIALGKKHPNQGTGLGDGLFPDPFVGTGYTAEKKDQIHAFQSWLKCYCQSEMRNMVDHNGRTIWFKVL
jgi:endonuclease VIII-like 1